MDIYDIEAFDDGYLKGVLNEPNDLPGDAEPMSWLLGWFEGSRYLESLGFEPGQKMTLH